MRLVFAVQGAPPEDRGGTEATTLSLATAMGRAGHRVTIVAGSDAAGAVPMLELEDGVRLIRVHRLDLHYEHWHKCLDEAAGREFERLLEEERPDVVHVHHWIRLSRDLVARAAGLGIPSILTLHDYTASCLVHHRVQPEDGTFCGLPPNPDECIPCAARAHVRTPWVDRAAEVSHFRQVLDATRAEIELANKVVALCHDHADALRAQLGLACEIAVVPPMRGDGSPPTPVRARVRRVHRRTLRLGTWGSLHPLKGVDLLIDALRIARRRGVDVELRVAGVEPIPGYAAALREHARGLPVEFHGGFEDLAEHPVTDVSAFVSGSRAHETWSRVVDESIELRLACILPRSGAFRERFANDDGALFYEPGDPASLADLLVRLDADPTILRRATERVATLALPNEDSIVSLYEALYHDARREGATPLPDEFADRRQALAEWSRRWDDACARTAVDPAPPYTRWLSTD